MRARMRARYQRWRCVGQTGTPNSSLAFPSNARLRIPEMMRGRWLAAPYQARVLGEMSKPSLDPEDCGPLKSPSIGTSRMKRSGPMRLAIAPYAST